MNLSASEQKMFDFFLENGNKAEVDELINLFPGATRNSIIVRIKYLSAKVSPHGWIITKETGTGRGVKAHYSIEKRF